MISTSKAFASLSSGLLARKGQAKPAMRPQGYAGYGDLQGALDDLGWNDMGSADVDASAGPVPVAPHIVSPPPPGVPSVLRERAHLREEIEAPMAGQVADEVAPDELAAEAADAPDEVIDAIAPEPVVVAAPVLVLPRRVVPDPAAIAPEPTMRARKAAFTLRLDPDRHFRLRLASAVTGRSAQQVVTEALDRWLEQASTIEDLARHLPTHEHHRA